MDSSRVASRSGTGVVEAVAIIESEEISFVESRMLYVCMDCKRDVMSYSQAGFRKSPSRPAPSGQLQSSTSSAQFPNLALLRRMQAYQAPFLLSLLACPAALLPVSPAKSVKEQYS